MSVAKSKNSQSLNPDQTLVDFLESLEVEKNLSQLTLRNYGHYLRRFNQWFKEEGHQDLRELDQENLRC